MEDSLHPLNSWCTLPGVNAIIPMQVPPSHSLRREGNHCCLPQSFKPEGKLQAGESALVCGPASPRERRVAAEGSASPSTKLRSCVLLVIHTGRCV